MPPPGYRPPGYGQQPGHRPQPRYGQQPGFRPGYGQQPAYGAPQGYPPPGYRPGMPAPMPYGPPGRPPQRPRKRGGGLLALALVVIVLVAGGLVLNAVRHVGLDDNAGGPNPSMTFSNDDGGSGSAETANNPLLTDPNATLIPARCAYSPWSTQVEVARKFFETAAGCLESAWQPVLAAADLPFTAPTVSVTASTAGVTTPCTGSTTNFAAFYCPANKTIYMPISQLQTDLFKDNWVVYLSVFAHEYGHHVQAMSGILRKANAERVDAGTRSDRGLELSRRVELQAQCFNGMYVGSSNSGGSLTSAQITLAKRDANGRGDAPSDSRDHGTPENSGNWFELGLDKNRTSQCNTFTASAKSVS